MGEADVTPEASGPELRVATPDDLPSMLPVLEAAFGRWPSFDIDVPPLEYLAWKMSPPGREWAHSVALVDGEVAAVSVRWGSTMRVEDEELELEGGVDQAVLPSMQGRGLGGAIGAFSHEAGSRVGDVSLGTGSNDPRIPTIFDRFDPVLVRYPLTVWSRAFEPAVFVAIHRGSGVRHLAASVGRGLLSRLPGRRAAARTPLAQIEELTSFDERADALWEEFAPSFELSIVRDATYLNWRYADPRAGRSLILGASVGGRLVGFAVFKRTADRANILDLVAAPGHWGVLRDLLEAGATRMRASGARHLDCWLPPGHPAEAALRAARFLPVRSDEAAGYGPQRRGRSSPTIDRLYEGTLRPHITMGDIDTY